MPASPFVFPAATLLAQAAAGALPWVLTVAEVSGRTGSLEVSVFGYEDEGLARRFAQSLVGSSPVLAWDLEGPDGTVVESYAPPA